MEVLPFYPASNVSSNVSLNPPHPPHDIPPQYATMPPILTHWSQLQKNITHANPPILPKTILPGGVINPVDDTQWLPEYNRPEVLINVRAQIHQFYNEANVQWHIKQVNAYIQSELDMRL